MDFTWACLGRGGSIRSAIGLSSAIVRARAKGERRAPRAATYPRPPATITYYKVAGLRVVSGQGPGTHWSCTHTNPCGQPTAFLSEILHGARATRVAHCAM